MSIFEMTTASPGSCTDFCAGHGYSCTAACGYDVSDSGRRIAAGAKRYRSSFDSYVVEAVASCEEPVPEQNLDGLALMALSCCCEIPAQTRLEDPDLGSPSSCDEVCAAEGLRCNPETYWELDELGFLEEASASVYVFRRTGAVAVNQGTCSEVPPLAEWDGYTLAQHRCGCN